MTNKSNQTPDIPLNFLTDYVVKIDLFSNGASAIDTIEFLGTGRSNLS